VIQELKSIVPLWNVPQVAKYLGKSPRWVWAALARPDEAPGSIPHHRVGRSPRFDPADIAAWVKAGCPEVRVWRNWSGDHGRGQAHGGHGGRTRHRT
jgi:hypothetical protein